MKNNGLVAIACFGLVVAQFFALTVELLDGYSGPSPMAVSAQAPITSPTLPQDENVPSPQLMPAAYTIPSNPLPQPAPQSMQRVDINYQQR